MYTHVQYIQFPWHGCICCCQPCHPRLVRKCHGWQIVWLIVTGLFNGMFASTNTGMFGPLGHEILACQGTSALFLSTERNTPTRKGGGSWEGLVVFCPELLLPSHTHTRRCRHRLRYTHISFSQPLAIPSIWERHNSEVGWVRCILRTAWDGKTTVVNSQNKLTDGVRIKDKHKVQDMWEHWLWPLLPKATLCLPAPTPPHPKHPLSCPMMDSESLAESWCFHPKT